MINAFFKTPEARSQARLIAMQNQEKVAIFPAEGFHGGLGLTIQSLVAILEKTKIHVYLNSENGPGRVRLTKLNH